MTRNSHAIDISDPRFGPRVWPRAAPVDSVFWHHGPPDGAFAVVPAVATTNGRAHRAGGPGTWYGVDHLEGVGAEIARHFLGRGVDAHLIVRRVGRVRVQMPLLDLTDPEVERALGIRRHDLVADDYRACQDVAAACRREGFCGMLAPSAALAGAVNVVVFPRGQDGLTVISTELVTAAELSINRSPL